MDNNTNDDSKIVYSLVIPCYNESENLVNLIERCEYLIKEKEDIEILRLNQAEKKQNIQEKITELNIKKEDAEKTLQLASQEITSVINEKLSQKV